MNRFTVDYSSSPPSTPDTRGKQPLRNPLFAGISSHPSTTPAGPPPSSAASFTPAGHPPSTTFGSSRLGSNVRKLQFSKDSLSSSGPSNSPLPQSDSVSQLPPRTKNGTPAKPKNRGFYVPSSSLANSRGAPSFEQSVNEDDEQDDEYMDEVEDDHNEKGGHAAFRGFTGINATHLRGPQHPPGPLAQIPSQSGRKSQFRSTNNTQRKPARLTQLPRKGKEDLIPGIARDMVSRSAQISLSERDNVILTTESLMKQLHEEALDAQTDENVQTIASQCAHELITVWGNQAKTEATPEDDNTVGPPPSATPFEKANYLASLLLALYHPPLNDDAIPNLRASTSLSMALVPASASKTMPIPQIILDWLDNYHVSYQALFQAVLSASPNCTSHPLFWDGVQSLMLRGKTREVGQLFAEADFKYAASALDDGSQEPGYHGAQLQAVQSLIYRARQVLEGCPGTKFADWQTDSADWDLYRKRVMTEVEHLAEIAEEADEDEDEELFQARNFGIRSADVGLLGRSIRKPTSGIPPTIFQNLKIMYRILLGSSEEILAQSQDWLEAATSLTIWWDGVEDDEIQTWSLKVSLSERPNQGSSASSPYLSRLRAAFLCTTDPDTDTSFQMNTMSTTEIGIGLILQGDIEGAVALLQTFSLCVSSAVAELGCLAGWIAQSSSSPASGLDQEDLMVLSYGANHVKFKKDDILYPFATALFAREEFVPKSGPPVEGWEISLSVASRFDDRHLTETTISEFLDQLQLQDQDRVEKLVSLCYNLGLEEEAQRVSEKFGDHLVNSTTMYGTALLCYSRSHASNKIRLVMDLLNSYCLVQSRAYPTEEEMDEDLRHLVESPKVALSGLADVDPDAAELLQFYLAGYACLRKFYDLRDDAITSTKTTGRLSRPIARKRLAAKALVAAICSAADCIYGGLYDAERQSAIQVDGLLTLLGEATAFLEKEPDRRTYTSDQMYALLAAIEDLQTVNSRVYDTAEECFQAALRNFHGSLPPSPHAMLKKSVSSGTNSNFSFSMMGSEMLARSEESGGGKSIGSMVMVGGSGTSVTERGWDWRSQFKGRGSTGADVLRCLRIGIAQELSTAEF